MRQALEMMVAFQMMGISMERGRGATPQEVDSCVASALDALKKCAAKAPEVEAIEREADRLRHGAPR